jgi:spore coat protein H
MRLAGGNHLLTWDAAVDLQGDAVTYTVELATTPDFAAGTVRAQQAGLSATALQIPLLANGSYYLRVTARDAKGNTQHAFDHTVVAGKTYHGVLAVSISGGVVTAL